MGLSDDIERFRQVGEEKREDLEDFIQTGDLMGGQGDIKVPIKVVKLPGFEYDKIDQGGVGQGEGQPGEDVGQPQPKPGEDGDEEGDPGDETEEHGYYNMDPEEFAEELSDDLGLDLDDKGKEKVIEQVEGDYTDIANQGTKTNLDMDDFIKKGLKRKFATDYDEEFLEEALKVDGKSAEEIFEWARDRQMGEDYNIPPISISYAEIEKKMDEVPEEERGKWEDFEEVIENVEYQSTVERIRENGIEHIPFRKDDERYRTPETEDITEKNVVIMNIRDVSGSMREKKRELVERTFVPLDWTLQGTYDNAEFVYIAHDSEAWEVEGEEFFGIKSGGGTQISSAYDLAQEILDEKFPWNEWNRYVFAAGDSENSNTDTKNRVIPLMEEIDANTHAYVSAQPGGAGKRATHADQVEDYFGDEEGYEVARVEQPDDCIDAIYQILDSNEVTE